MQSEMKSRDPVISLEHIFEKYFFLHPVLWMSSQNSALVSFLVAHAAPSQDPAYPQASVDSTSAGFMLGILMLAGYLF